MGISSAGRIKNQAGVTLIEMMIVLAIIGLIVGITLPAATSGLDSIRLSSAAESIASFLNAALNRCERRQEVVEVTVSPNENALLLHSTEPGFERRLELPAGIKIEGDPQNVIVMPGGTAPRIGVQIANSRGSRRMVRVDPITGVPQIEVVGAN